MFNRLKCVLNFVAKFRISINILISFLAAGDYKIPFHL